MSVWSWINGDRRRVEPADQILAQAVRDLRDNAGVERMSVESRAFVVDEIVSGSGAPAPSGLRHVAGIALAVGAVPVVLGAVVLMAIGHGADSNGPDWVKVEKTGAEVVFTLDDPTGSHRVLASTDARHFAGARELFSVDGTVQVSVEHEPKLVFYRVD